MNEEDYLIYLDWVQRFEKRIPLNKTESGKRLLIEIKEKIRQYENKKKNLICVGGYNAIPGCKL